MKSFSVILFAGAILCLFSPADAQTGPSNTAPAPVSAEKSDIEEIKQALATQAAEMAKLRKLVEEQAAMIARLEKAEAPKQPVEKALPQQESIEARLAKVEEQSKRTTESVARNQLGNLGFSGDMRLQYDSQYGLLNNAANVFNPAILGNELSSRQRLRFRLRVAVRGKIGADVFSGSFTNSGEKRMEKEFEWGFRIASGTTASPVSENAVLTDFFSKKPLSLDQAYVAWRPKPAPGLKIIAGKFEPTWARTEMTLDNDLQAEGVSEVFSRDIRNSFVKNITFTAWQLPMLERGSTFVRNANGTVNITESERNGRDLGFYGAQLQSRFALNKSTNLTLSISDQYFAHTAAITPVQVFGNNLQIPVMITIPATGTTPAQTISTVVNIPREFLLSGNGNLGLSNATNASVNRDGRLASGFNLVDILAQLDVRHFKYNPLTLILDFVRNTQTRDVIVAGPGGGDQFVKNNNGEGFWGEFRFQNLRRSRGNDFNAAVSGDVLLSYTYLRIEKDAVLTPFNWDDLVQASDVQAHRAFVSFTVDPRVTFNITGIFSRRLNGLLGPYVNEPAGSLDKMTNRLQIDTVFRF